MVLPCSACSAGKPGRLAFAVYWPGVLAATFAFAALFHLMGACLRRAPVLAILYAFFFETIAGNLPGHLKRLSLSFYARCLMFDRAHAFGLQPEPSHGLPPRHRPHRPRRPRRRNRGPLVPGHVPVCPQGIFGFDLKKQGCGQLIRTTYLKRGRFTRLSREAMAWFCCWAQAEWGWTETLLGLLSIPVLVALNAFFVAGEFALVAVRKTRVEEMVANKVKGARAVAAALEQLNRTIAATQLGVTLSSLGLGWVAESILAQTVENLFADLPDPGHLITLHSVAGAKRLFCW